MTKDEILNGSLRHAVELEAYPRTGYVTTHQAAPILGLKTQSVRQLIFRGALTAYTYDSHTFISLTDIGIYLREKKRRKR